MKQAKIWYLGGGILLAVWLLAYGIIAYARSQKMTAEKVLSFVGNNPLKGMDREARLRAINELADRVNRLSFDERQKVRFEKSIRQVYEEMTDEERTRYLDLTLSAGMKQMMEAFNKMGPEQRKKLVNRAISEMDKAQDSATREDVEKALNDRNVRKVIDEGLKTYMTDADASAKLDIQPLMEQMQGMLQSMR